MSSQPKIALVLFAREPRPGKVKSRLAEAVGPEAACEIYEAMARDVWNMMLSTGLPCVLSSDSESAPWLPNSAGLLPQPEGSFGTRIQDVLLKLGDSGYNAAIALAADTPHLSVEILTKALSALAEEKNLVTCPSEDGGLILLGLRLPSPIDLVHLPWETDKLDEALIELGNNLRFTRLLPGSYDIDEIDDVRRLLGENEEVLERCPLTVEACRIILG